jgi:hypothetical protein
MMMFYRFNNHRELDRYTHFVIMLVLNISMFSLVYHLLIDRMRSNNFGVSYDNVQLMNYMILVGLDLQYL